MAAAAALGRFVLRRGQHGHVGMVEEQLADYPTQAVVQMATDVVVAAVDGPHAVVREYGSKSDPSTTTQPPHIKTYPKHTTMVEDEVGVEDVDVVDVDVVWLLGAGA